MTGKKTRLASSEIMFLSALPEVLGTKILEACTLKQFTMGEVILSESDPTTDLFFLLEGTVAVKAFSDLGYQVSYVELRAGTMFGEFAALDGATRSANVEALSRVTVARLRRDQLYQFLQQEPALGIAFSVHLVKRARALSERIFEFSTFPVAQRIRLELLRLGHAVSRHDDHVIIKPAPTHQEIAARISTHREAVSREIADLVKQRILKSGRQSIEIVSMSALQKTTEDIQRSLN